MKSQTYIYCFYDLKRTISGRTNLLIGITIAESENNKIPGLDLLGIEYCRPTIAAYNLQSLDDLLVAGESMHKSSPQIAVLGKKFLR